MAISPTITSGPFIGTGLQTAFPFDFTVSSAGELYVLVDNVQQSPSLYTVALSTAGTGVVNFSTAPAAGTSVLIVSQPDWTQETVFETDGSYTLDQVNAVNRRDGVRSNWLARMLALIVPSGWQVAANRAGKYLAWDASGNPVATTGTGADASLRTDLAATTGSTLLGWLQAGTGAVLRNMRDKVREHVSIDDFGAVGDGTTNDAAALTAACTYLAATGGIVELAQTKTYAILSNVTIPPNVYVRHGAGRRGNPGNDWATGPIASQPHIKLASTATITMSSNSGLEAIILRNGMTIPAVNTSAYAGTAIRLAPGGCNDVILRVMVIGFAICVDGTNGGDRQDWIVEADGNPGAGVGSVIVGPSFDSGFIRVRSYPWGTVAYPTSPALTRTGIGTQILAGVQDDTRFDLMDYGHAIGIECKANGNVHFEHVWTDNNATAGVDIYGVDRATFEAIWAYATPNGVRILGNGTVNIGYYLFDGGGVAGSVGFATAAAISSRVNIGHLHIASAVSWGVSLGSTTAVLNIGAAHLQNIRSTVAPYIVGPVGWTSDQCSIGKMLYCDLPVGSSLFGGNVQALPALASAAALALPVAYDHYQVTGTTNITSITGTWNDRRIVLTFSGALTVTNGAGLALAGGANFVTAAGKSIALWYDQPNSTWREMWRA